MSDWRRVLAAGDVPAELLPATDAEWKSVLEPMAYAVLREEGTEPKWSSPLNQVNASGVFRCAGCGAPLFTTAAKFESGSGWPSFYAPADAGAVDSALDFRAIVPRTETTCAKCGGHLGHVFDDGPLPTGLRYCMNGAALEFEPADGASPRADAAVAAFDASVAAGTLAPPPLAKTALDLIASALLCLGLLYSFAVTEQARAGAPWALDALKTSDTWLFGSVNFVFGGRPPGGPLTLVLAALNAAGAAQKAPLLGEAWRRRPRGGGGGR